MEGLAVIGFVLIYIVGITLQMQWLKKSNVL